MRTAALAELQSSIWAHWRPPPRLSLSAWADAHFYLSAGDPNAGRWKTLPYQREMMDAVTDPGIETVTVMKSSRIGFTKGMLCATVGYYIAHDPAQMLIVQPTLDDAQKHSKEDIAPMLRDVPVLRGLVSEAKAKDGSNTLLDKTFIGGSVSLVGANSPRGFRRTSRRIIICDELDGYPASAGTEGNPYELAKRRSEYYWDRKIIAGSTPTLAGYSAIETLFLAGDQRRRYLPCPHCGTYQVLQWRNLKWLEDRPGDAYFLCVGNGCVIEHRHKRDMDARGEWRAEAPEHFSEDNRHASFHIWAAYSYSPNSTWGDLAHEWIKANQGGEETRKTYINQVRGEVYTMRGEAPEWELLYRRRESYPIGSLPPGVLFLTAGVDVQADRLVVEVVGWGRGKQSWSIDYLVLPGETANLDHGPWMQLDALLNRSFLTATGTVVSILMLAVDSGYNTQTVYGWARRYPINRVIAIKGQPSGGALVSAPVPVEISARGRKLVHGYKHWPVSTHIAKIELYGWLRLDIPADGESFPPGFCHFPEYGEDYFRQLTAEQLKVFRTRKGYIRQEWEQIPGRENHVLDCRVYSRAAASVVGMDRFTESDWLALERVAGVGTATPPKRSQTGPPEHAQHVPERVPIREPWIGRPRGSWLRR